MEISGITPSDNISLEASEAQDDMLNEMPNQVRSEGLAQSLPSVGPLGWLIEGLHSLLRVVTNKLSQMAGPVD